MSGNSPRSPRVKKVDNYKKPKEKVDDFMITPLETARIENHSKKGFRVIRPDGSLHRPSAKKLLKMGNMNVKKQAKIVRGERIRSKSKRPKRTVRYYGPNPDCVPSSPKNKSCCERWFGRDAGKKKCKKKCKTRKKKRKKRTRKRKKRKKKKR